MDVRIGGQKHMKRGRKNMPEQEVAVGAPRPVMSQLNSLPAVRREMIRVYKDTRTGVIPASVGSKLVFMLLTISKQLEAERDFTGGLEAGFGQTNIYGIPAFVTKEQWMEKYASGPVVVVDNTQH